MKFGDIVFCTPVKEIRQLNATSAARDVIGLEAVLGVTFCWVIMRLGNYCSQQKVVLKKYYRYVTRNDRAKFQLIQIRNDDVMSKSSHSEILHQNLQ